MVKRDSNPRRRETELVVESDDIELVSSSGGGTINVVMEDWKDARREGLALKEANKRR